jgi:cobalt/nickel transport system permease protein
LSYNVVEGWSRGSSPLHRRAAAAKLFSLAVFLVVLATAHRRLPLLAAALAIILAAGFHVASIPLLAAMTRAAAVLPFTGVFAVISWMSGNPTHAIELVLKSYLSAMTVLLLVGTTQIPELLGSLELVKVPRFLLTVALFLYRYLFLVVDEAAHMRAAAAARGGITFKAASGALAVLFMRSYSRAEAIHRAMTARGFDGRFRPLFHRPFAARDLQFAAVASGLPLLARALTEWWR